MRPGSTATLTRAIPTSKRSLRPWTISRRPSLTPKSAEGRRLPTMSNSPISRRTGRERSRISSARCASPAAAMATFQGGSQSQERIWSANFTVAGNGQSCSSTARSRRAGGTGTNPGVYVLEGPADFLTDSFTGRGTRSRAFSSAYRQRGNQFGATVSDGGTDSLRRPGPPREFGAPWPNAKQTRPDCAAPSPIRPPRPPSASDAGLRVR